MVIKKGDLVTTVGSLKEVVDFLSKADAETLRLLRTFLQGGTPVEDAKLLTLPRKVNKVYKDTLEVSLSKMYVWEENLNYFVRVSDETEGSSSKRNTLKVKDLEGEPRENRRGDNVPSADTRSSESSSLQDIQQPS